MAGTPAGQVQVKGAKELRAALKKMGEDLADMKETHRLAAERVAEEARSRAPYISGTLAGTIRASGTETRASIRAGFKKVPYAGPIHFGWPARNIRPQPFLYEALDERGDEVVRLYEDRVEDLVERVLRDTPP